MENENSNVQSDLEDTLIINEKRLLSSTLVEDNCDQSTIEIKKETPVMEIVEETVTSFIVEDSGVIHIKTERISKNNSTTKEIKQSDNDGKEASAGDKASQGGTDVPKDVKTEDGVLLQKNESTVAEIYLQLDVTDTLDAYLERERVRKLNLSKAADGKSNEEKENCSNENLDASVGESPTYNKKVSLKRVKKDSTKKGELHNIDPKVSVEDIKGDAKSLESNDVEAEKEDVSNHDVSNSVKSEQTESDKKDNNRFIWVSNISKTTKATDLKMHLAAFGKVQLAKIVTDGKECFGYVVLESHEDVVNCMKNLQNSTFESKQIVLSEKIPEKKHTEKANDLKDEKLDKKKKEQKAYDRKDAKLTKSDYRKSLSSDPLTLKVSDAKKRRYSEDRRKMEELEHKRLLRERISLERREIERKRRELEKERERERERERQRERERELRRRERIESERQKQVELKLERERKKLEFERKMIEKEKLELLRYKRKLLSKDDEDLPMDSRGDLKKRGNLEDYDRKKFVRMEEHGSKHSSIDISKDYWKNENIKPSHDAYKKNNQEVCIAPPPPILSNNYHSLPERSRPADKDRQWYERKDYETRPKSYSRKMEDNRNYGISNENRQSYQDKPFPKEEYKHKNYDLMQPHGSWDGYPEPPYKEQNIPVLRSEPPRTMQRHQGYQEGPHIIPLQDYYSGPNYRRANDYYNRSSERKY